MIILKPAVFTLIFLSMSFGAHASEKTPIGFFDILKHVYETHPALNAARERKKETEELYNQATANWKPSINAEAGIYATDIDNSNFGAGDGATTKNYGLSIDQPLWQGGQGFSRLREAKDLINASEALLHEVEQSVFLETIRTILALKRDRDLLKLRQRNEQSLQEEYTATQERYNSGVLTLTDVEQTKSRLKRAEASTINAERAVEISQAEFTEVTGLTENYSLDLPKIDFQFPDNIDEILLMADQNNPSLWIAKYEESAAQHNTTSEQRELLPQISAFASYNKEYDPQPGIVPDNQVETVGLRAVIPLYQAGVKRSEIRQAKYAAKRRSYESEEIIRRIRQNVVKNYRDYITSREEVEIRKSEVTATDEALKGIKEEVNLGQRALLALLDTDRDLINAQISGVSALYNYELANFALAENLGILNAVNLGITDTGYPQ